MASEKPSDGKKTIFPDFHPSNRKKPVEKTSTRK